MHWQLVLAACLLVATANGLFCYVTKNTKPYMKQGMYEETNDKDAACYVGRWNFKRQGTRDCPFDDVDLSYVSDGRSSNLKTEKDKLYRLVRNLPFVHGIVKTVNNEKIIFPANFSAYGLKHLTSADVTLYLCRDDFCNDREELTSKTNRHGLFTEAIKNYDVTYPDEQYASMLKCQVGVEWEDVKFPNAIKCNNDPTTTTPSTTTSTTTTTTTTTTPTTTSTSTTTTTAEPPPPKPFNPLPLLAALFGVFVAAVTAGLAYYVYRLYLEYLATDDELRKLKTREHCNLAQHKDLISENVILKINLGNLDRNLDKLKADIQVNRLKLLAMGIDTKPSSGKE